ncbi:MAG: cysteine--tRNA ligase [Lentisphaeria bacterium]|nr:cysteine--tRNA ligase [Lentisphaeria bacterium]
MEISFFNTMDRKQEVFRPVHEGEARMYTCGPTVYNFAHIGNFRAYMFEDLLRRALEYAGYKVTQVMNLTDVDDKTIRDSRKQNMKLNDFTAIYKKAFFDDLKTLGIEPAEVYPAATDHIPEMIALVSTLMEKGYAYQAEDKSIYFSIDKFPEYGKLAKIDRENQRAGVRISTDEYAKDSVADFALWKAWDENDGDVFWESPWGKGRPGWHIECSAMAMKYLGKTFDIHTGGIDNMFPHHEDEIAQSECANGCKYVNYWLHCAHLMVNGEKMSKSLGNFFTLRDLMDKGFKGREIRYVLLGAHYRKKLNFTFDALKQAASSLAYFDELFIRLKEANGNSCPDINEFIAQYDAEFNTAICDDLNVSGCNAVIFKLGAECNKRMDAGSLSAADSAKILDLFRKFDRIFGFLNVDAAKKADIPQEIIELAQKRVEAKKNKDWASADALRNEIQSAGYIIEDAPGNTFRIKKA